MQGADRDAAFDTLTDQILAGQRASGLVGHRDARDVLDGSGGRERNRRVECALQAGERGLDRGRVRSSRPERGEGGVRGGVDCVPRRPVDLTQGGGVVPEGFEVGDPAIGGGEVATCGDPLRGRDDVLVGGDVAETGGAVATGAVCAVGEKYISASAKPPAGTAIRIAERARFQRGEFMEGVLSGVNAPPSEACRTHDDRTFPEPSVALLTDR